MPYSEADLIRIVRTAVLDAEDPGDKGPDNRIGNSVRDTQLTARRVHDQITPGVAGTKTEGPFWRLVTDIRQQLTGVAGGVAELINRPAAEVDEAALAAQLAPHLAALAPQLPDDTLARIAQAVNDERDRRERDSDPSTGQVS